MPEIGTSGSMSGDGKRGVAEWPKLPRPSSTLPKRRFAASQPNVRSWRNGHCARVANVSRLTDAVEKVFLGDRTIFSRGADAMVRK
jgi:hypothetical protein